MSLLMGRDYVTIREEDHDGETVWTETSVGRALLKSAPARVTKVGNDYRIVGAAWGAPIDKVEVKSRRWAMDAGDDRPQRGGRIRLEDLVGRLADSAAGEHTITSRAIDASGNIQPAMDDPSIAKKHTYWESNGQVTRRVNVG